MRDLLEWIGVRPGLCVSKGMAAKYIFSRGLANEYREELVATLLGIIETAVGPEFDCSQEGVIQFPQYKAEPNTPFSDCTLIYFVDSAPGPKPYLLGGSVPASFFYKGRRWSDSRLTRRFYVGFNLLKAQLQEPESPLDAFFCAFPTAKRIEVVKSRPGDPPLAAHLTATTAGDSVTITLDPGLDGTPVESLWSAVLKLKEYVEGHDIHPEILDSRTLELLQPIDAFLKSARVATDGPFPDKANWTAILALCAYYDWPFTIRLFQDGDARVVITHAEKIEPTDPQKTKLLRLTSDLRLAWMELRSRASEATSLAKGGKRGFLGLFRKEYKRSYRVELGRLGKRVSEAVEQAMVGFRWSSASHGKDPRHEIHCRAKDIESLCDRLADHVLKAPALFGKQLADTDGEPDRVLKAADAELGDLLGVRVVVPTDVEVLRLASLLLCKPLSVNGASVSPDPKRRKGLLRREASMWATGYRSVHLQYNLDAPGLPLDKVRVELQIRSRLAHVWSELEHDVRYKGGIALFALEKAWRERGAAADSYHLGEDASAILTGINATAHGLHQQDREIRHMVLAYERLLARYGPSIGRRV